jgi:hypothetical protein
LLTTALYWLGLRAKSKRGSFLDEDTIGVAFREFVFCAALASATKAALGLPNKNPEVVLGAFVSASSSL